MAHSTMEQVQYGAFHYGAGPVWRIPVCRNSGVALFQSDAVSLSYRYGACILISYTSMICKQSTATVSTHEESPCSCSI